MTQKFTDEGVNKILNEMYNQQLKKPIATIKLPCSDKHQWKEPVLMQIHEPRDQTIICPKCGKHHYLIWSKIESNAKWRK